MNDERASNGSDDRLASESGSTPITQKDEELLTWLVRLRMLSIDQLQRLLFPDQHQAVVSRALRRLREKGLVATWDEPRGRGGRRRYALPTASGIRRGIDVLRGHLSATPVERLVESMLPAYARRPLNLTARMLPPFLAHQRECNHLAISFAGAAGPALWVSTWDRPFPPAIGGVAMPQPDAVLVLQTQVGQPKLVFLEHDRGQESRAHFEGAKIERYVQLARTPQFCEDLFGFREFVVAVTVADVARRRPFARLKALSQFTAGRGASGLFLFTLGGWAHAHPLGPIWFADGAVPRGRVLRPDAHPNLRSLIERSGEMASCQNAIAIVTRVQASDAGDLASERGPTSMPAPLSSRFNDGAQNDREPIHNPVV